MDSIEDADWVAMGRDCGGLVTVTKTVTETVTRKFMSAMVMQSNGGSIHSH